MTCDLKHYETQESIVTRNCFEESVRGPFEEK